MTPSDARARRDLDTYAVSTPRMSSQSSDLFREVGRKSQYYENKQIGRVKFNVLKQAKTNKDLSNESEMLISSPGIEKSKSNVIKSPNLNSSK